MKIVVLDIDSVLANFCAAYGDALAKVHGVDLRPADWRSSSDFPPCWDWDTHLGYSAEVQRTTWSEHILTPNNFWLKLKPLPTARESLMMLNGLVKAGEIQLYFISDRSGNRVAWQTQQWLFENGCDFPQVILGANKVPFLRALQPCLFVDDKPEHLMAVAKAAHEERWPNFQLFAQDMPYNRAVKVCPRVSTIKEALQTAGLWTT